MTFTFTQDVPFNFTNVNCTCLLTGGVTASNTLTGQTIFSSSAYPFSNTWTLRITIDPTLNKQITASLQFYDAYSVLRTLVFDLAPFIMIPAQSPNTGGCPGFVEGIYFTFYCNGIPTDNLVMTVDPPNPPGAQVLQAVANPSCTFTRSFALGIVGCSGNVVFQFQRRIGPPTVVPLHWTDGSLTLPPSTITI